MLEPHTMGYPVSYTTGAECVRKPDIMTICVSGGGQSLASGRYHLIQRMMVHRLLGDLNGY